MGKTGGKPEKKSRPELDLDNINIMMIEKGEKTQRKRECEIAISVYTFSRTLTSINMEIINMLYVNQPGFTIVVFFAS